MWHKKNNQWIYREDGGCVHFPVDQSFSDIYIDPIHQDLSFSEWEQDGMGKTRSILSNGQVIAKESSFSQPDSPWSETLIAFCRHVRIWK